MTTLAAFLTPAESDRLAACEAAIERGLTPLSAKRQRKHR